MGDVGGAVGSMYIAGKTGGILGVGFELGHCVVEFEVDDAVVAGEV